MKFSRSAILFILLSFLKSIYCSFITVDMLRQALKDRGQPTSGKKADLIPRLIEVMKLNGEIVDDKRVPGAYLNHLSNTPSNEEGGTVGAGR